MLSYRNSFGGVVGMAGKPEVVQAKWLPLNRAQERPRCMAENRSAPV